MNWKPKANKRPKEKMDIEEAANVKLRLEKGFEG
jgi:hypothetical protein